MTMTLQPLPADEDADVAAEEERARQAAMIAEQNDRFRKSFGADFAVPGRIVATPGVAALGYAARVALMGEVMRFDTFTEANDPHGQHDFGVVTVEGQRVYWKLDYYDPALAFGSNAPHDPAQTVRVMTLLLPSEY